MRSVNYEHSYYEQVKKTDIICREQIDTLYEEKSIKRITVKVQRETATGKTMEPVFYVVDGEKYDLLISESPDFAPGKPANEYREVDVWHIIDMIRLEEATS